MTLGLQNALDAQLRYAIRRSAATQEVVRRLAQRDEYARELLHGSEGSEDDPKKLLWRNAKDRQRQDEYRRWSDLYHGEHDKFLPAWLPRGKAEIRVVNFCRFITHVYADLMLGDGVEISTGHRHADEYIRDTACLPDYFYDWAQAVSVYGVYGLQVVVSDCAGQAQVDIIDVPSSDLYWEYVEGSATDFEWVAKKSFVSPDQVRQNMPDDIQTYLTGYKPGEHDVTSIDGVVFEERHYRGRIEYYLYAVAGDEIVELYDPRWYDPDLPELDEDGLCVTDTGVDDFLLHVVGNTTFDRRHASDYADIDTLQTGLNSRYMQIARTLNVHSNPKLMLPESMQQEDDQTGQQVVRGLRDEVLFISPEVDTYFTPQYLTWDAQLSAAYDEIDRMVNAICTLAEISPMLIVGKDTGGVGDSGVAYRLKLTPTLNKVNRKKARFMRSMQRLLRVFLLKCEQYNVWASTEYVPAGVRETDTETVSETGITAENNGIPSGFEPFMPVNSIIKQEQKSLRGIRAHDITIKFLPTLPQDDKWYVDRLGGKASVSLRRVLKTVDGLSDEEVEKEIAAIQEDEQAGQEAFANNSGFGYNSAADADQEGFHLDSGQQGPELLDGALDAVRNQQALSASLGPGMIR